MNGRRENVAGGQQGFEGYVRLKDPTVRYGQRDATRLKILDVPLLGQ